MQSPVAQRLSESCNSQQAQQTVSPVLKKRASTILKRGDGPINFDWNERYLVLDSQTLMYFKSHDEKTPRGFLRLKDCIVSQITSTDDRDHCFIIESFLPPKKYYFSGLTRQETKSWQ